MVDLGRCNNKAMTSEQCSRAADGRSDLENFRIKQDAGILTFRSGTEHVGAHGSVGRGQINVFFAKSHGKRMRDEG